MVREKNSPFLTQPDPSKTSSDWLVSPLATHMLVLELYTPYINKIEESLIVDEQYSGTVLAIHRVNSRLLNRPQVVRLEEYGLEVQLSIRAYYRTPSNSANAPSCGQRIRAGVR